MVESSLTEQRGEIMKDLVFDYLDICDTIAELEARKKKLGENILAMTDSDGIIVEGMNLRRETRRTLVAEKLQKIVSSSLWTNITKRTPVAALVKAAVTKGQISQSDLDNCYKTGSPYLIVR